MKGLMPHTTTATELQRNFKSVNKRAKKTKVPLIVLSNNKPEGVYMDYKLFISRQKNMSKINSSNKSNLDQFFGLWTKEEEEEFNKVIDETCEQIDPEM